MSMRFITGGDSREPELAGIWGATVGSVLTLVVPVLTRVAVRLPRKPDEGAPLRLVVKEFEEHLSDPMGFQKDRRLVFVETVPVETR